jgi:hypothetical protein
VELFDPKRHQSLIEIPWDPDLARTAIERIVGETRDAFAPDGLWPVHPQDTGLLNPSMDQTPEPGSLTSLWAGAAGVIWGLDHLVRERAASPGPTFADHLPDIQDRNRRFLESDSWRESLGPAWQTRSWLLGDAGILFAQWKTAPSNALLATLAEIIAENSDDPILELMWGAPGTMLAAVRLHDMTGDPTWADLFRRGATALGDALEYYADLDCQLWTQYLYGARSKLTGAVHGFAGNAFAIIRGRRLLAPGEWDRWADIIATTTLATAHRDGSLANWPQSIGTPRPGRTDMLVQHCHGAPGMVNALAASPDPRLDQVLIEAGELTWAAGPLSKGAGLCHGTGGNGYAFLKLFERTGDDEWLARARSFAMHAIAQIDAEVAELGRRRHTLWLGDIGVACFLWECLQATARFPTMDIL